MQPLLSATFPPVIYPPFAPVAQGSDQMSGGAYERKPILTSFQLPVGDDAQGHPTRTVLTMGRPGWIKMLAVRPAPAASTGVRVEVQVTPMGSGEVFQTSWTDLAGRNWLPFTGPYCYLPDAGLYEVFASGAMSAGGPLTYIDCQMAQGVSYEMFQSMLTPHAAHMTGSRSITVGAGASNFIGDYSSTFPNLRRALIQNTGANVGIVVIGLAAETCAQFSLAASGAANSSIELPPEVLGRHSVRVSSVAGTTFMVATGRW